MSREIKFRAWHKKRKIFLRNITLPSILDMHTGYYPEDIAVMELQQMISPDLEDINEVSFYEGDIVRKAFNGEIFEDT